MENYKMRLDGLHINEYNQEPNLPILQKAVELGYDDRTVFPDFLNAPYLLFLENGAIRIIRSAKVFSLSEYPEISINSFMALKSIRDFMGLETISDAEYQYIPNRKVLYQALNKWGTDLQIQMIQEECMELALAIQKYMHREPFKACNDDQVIDEIADVIIMIEQAKIIFDQNSINKRVAVKMNRLKDKLK